MRRRTWLLMLRRGSGFKFKSEHEALIEAAHEMMDRLEMRKSLHRCEMREVLECIAEGRLRDALERWSASLSDESDALAVRPMTQKIEDPATDEVMERARKALEGERRQ